MYIYVLMCPYICVLIYVSLCVLICVLICVLTYVSLHMCPYICVLVRACVRAQAAREVYRAALQRLTELYFDVELPGLCVAYASVCVPLCVAYASVCSLSYTSMSNSQVSLQASVGLFTGISRSLS